MFVRSLLGLICLFPGLAFAQPAAPPETQALGQEIMACVADKVALRTRIAVLEAEKPKPAAEPAK